MVHRRPTPWILALLLVLGLRSPAASAAPIQFTGNVTPGLQPGDEPQRRHHAGEHQSAEHRPVPVDHGQRLDLGLEHPGHPDQLRRDDRHALRRHQHVQERQRSACALRPGQRRPLRHARPDTTPRTWAATSRSPLAIAPINPTNLSQPGTPLIVAGVPADKTIAGTGTDGFTVSSYNATKAASSGLAYAFGTSLPQNMGNLAFDPELGPPATGVHHQELQQDPRPRSRLRDSGSRRTPARARTASPERPTCPGRRSRPTPNRTSPSRRPGWPGRSSSARPPTASPERPPEPSSGLRFGPSNRLSSKHPCARRRPGPGSPLLFIGRSRREGLHLFSEVEAATPLCPHPRSSLRDLSEPPSFPDR